MKASLNLKPCEVPAELTTVGDLVAYVEKERVPHGQVVTHIILDGENLDEGREVQFASKLLSECEMVEFYSARVADIIKEGLNDATQLLPSLAEDLPAVAIELRSGQVQNGIEMFGQCIEIISWYVNLISRVDEIHRQSDPSFRINPASVKSPDDQDLGSDLTALTAEEGTELRTFASFENLRQKLIDVEQAQANDDTLLLADLIEYELVPIVAIWVKEVPIFNAKVSREGGTA